MLQQSAGVRGRAVLKHPVVTLTLQWLYLPGERRVEG
jgi:hypothetical protein